MKREIRSVDDIRLMVDVFYDLAGRDKLLGPIFRNMKDSAPHREMLYQYWENQILNESAGEDQSFPEHISLMFTTQHFIRWLGLFLETIDTLYGGAVADKAKVILIRKSEEFQMKLEILRF